jgi:hypothetical protein
MGFWLNDDAIQRIVSRLDYKFSDSGPNTGIRKIRSTPSRRRRFNAGTSGTGSNGIALQKIARRMRVWGSPGGPATAHSKKWWAFLFNLHSKANQAAGGGADAAEDLKKYIATALDSMKCVSIKFAAVTGTDLRVTSSAIPLPEDETQYITLIILQTPDHDGSQVQDPGTDGDEDPSGEDPATVAVLAAAKRTGKTAKGAGSKAKKKSAGKTAKKKAASKKSTRKRRG